MQARQLGVVLSTWRFEPTQVSFEFGIRGPFDLDAVYAKECRKT